MSTDQVQTGQAQEQELLVMRTSAMHLLPFLRAINAVVDEPELHISPEGIEVAMLDPGHYSYVHAVITHSSRIGFRAGKGVVALPLDKMLEVLSRRSMEATLTLTIKGDRVLVELREIGTTMLYEFRAPPVAGTSYSYDPQNLVIKARAVTRSKALHHAIRACARISQSARVTITSHEIILAANESGTSVSQRIPATTTGEGSALYSTVYLEKLTGACAAVGETTTVQIAEKGVLRLDCDAAIGHIMYLLAPRME